MLRLLAPFEGPPPSSASPVTERSPRRNLPVTATAPRLRYNEAIAMSIGKEVASRLRTAPGQRAEDGRPPDGGE
jgi:hypothetical protein